MGIVPAIDRSASPLEIRVYRWNMHRLRGLVFGTVSVITCDSGRVKVMNYTGRGELPADSSDAGNMRAVGWHPVVGDGGRRYYALESGVYPKMSIDSLMQLLITYRLYILEDETMLIDSLRRTEPPDTVAKEDRELAWRCPSCLPQDTLLVEIKIAERIRNFGMKAAPQTEPPSLSARLRTYMRLRELLFALINPLYKPA